LTALQSLDPRSEMGIRPITIVLDFGNGFRGKEGFDSGQ
jgi:hypothetical protein